MVDRDPKPTLLEAHGVRLEQTHMGLAVWGIPDDDGGPARLDVVRGFDDIFLQMQSHTDETFFTGGMRFRSYSGGGGIWQIAESFMRMGSSFQESEGQKFKKAHPILRKQPFEIPSYWELQTSAGKEQDDPKFSVLNIPGDQDEEQSPDITVLSSGDVRLTMRNPRLGEMGVRKGTAYPPDETMVFKTKENGGAFPAVNALLAELTEKIATAKKNKSTGFDKAFA